ncbi:hypothetical protein CCACVL1_22783 [Corchorus capsularis]|uniref:Synergin gamma C-terminal domain-containing protein n=1 Tax=Corchorus capsularis TaxID=210143 RepID=A0A1R3GWW1_COCAP|nr:hypothetical protein CCACVL1_22783 [Corchorus capsularis]
MAENDDEEGFGDFKFISSSSSHSINGPDFFTTNKINTVAAAVDDDDDWGDFVKPDNSHSRTESLPANRFHFDPFPSSSSPTQPDSAPSRVESGKNQWAKVSGALPLSFFGEEEKEEEEVSGAVDAGFNGGTVAFSFPKKDGNLKGKGSGLNDLIADLYKQSGNGKEGNGFGSGLDSKKGVDLNPKEESWNWNGSVLKVDGLDLSGNDSALVKEEEHLGSNGDAFGMETKQGNMGLSGLNLVSNGPAVGQSKLTLDSNGGNSDLVDEEEDDDGWEFKVAESKAEASGANFKSDQNEPKSNSNVSTFSWDPLGTNVSRLNSKVNGVNSNASELNSSLFNKNEEFGDDGWEFKTAESETHSGADSAKVERRDQENLKGVEFNFGFGTGVNGLSNFVGSSGELSNKPGEWDLGFSFAHSFGTQSKQNTEHGVIVSPIDQNFGSDEMSWAFKDPISENEPKSKEEPNVADTSSPGVEDISFNNHIQGNEEKVEKQKGALPLSIFGDAELEPDDSLRYEDVSVHQPTSARAVMKDTHSNISINDLISSLYSQAEKNASINHISNPSGNELHSSQTVVGSNLVNGDDDFDDDSWDFKGAVSGTREENQNSQLSSGDSYEKYSTKLGLNDYVDFYSKLTAELCSVSLIHLDKMKKDRSIAVPSGEDAEVNAIEKEFQDLYIELQKDGIISKEVTSENLQSRSIYLEGFADVLQENKFQMLESEYHLSEKLSLAEKDLKIAIELLKHAASTLKIVKLGSFEDQSNYVSTWSRILSVCVLELKHGALIWKQSSEKNIQSHLLSKLEGRQYILALGEIYRVVKIIEASLKLYKPWIMIGSEYPTNFLALVRESYTLWSSSGLEEALQTLSDATDLKYDVKALLGSIQSVHDLDAHELYKQVSSREELTCCLSGLSAGTVPGLKMVVWDGRHYFLTIANLWANLISHSPPNLPHLANEDALGR